MGGAILHGALAGGVAPANTFLFDLDARRLAQTAKSHGVRAAADTAELSNCCDIVIVAVKPYGVLQTLRDIKSRLNNHNPLFVSVAAGVTIAEMEESLGSSSRVVRTMPNTPAMVGEGMTAVCAGTNVSQEDVGLVCELFNLFGKAEVIDERLIDASMGISGCAPAYVYMFIEALADAGVMHGLSRSSAYTMAAQAVLGASKMVLETGQHPGALKDAVCSPGGTTIEAVAALERAGFRGSVINAVDAAVNKGKNMKG